MNNQARPALILILTLSIVFIGNCRKGAERPGGAPTEPEKLFVLELSNPLQAELADQAVVIPLADLLSFVPDFNPMNCRLAGPRGEVLPFQMDDLDGDGKPDEVAFLATLPPGKSEIAVRYSPTGTKPPDFPVRTYARLAWETADANIGWESNRAAYRFYWGQLEAFGKLDERLIMSAFTADYGYHEMQDWGMDILHVGEASGLGGISLWEGEKRISTVNPAGKGGNQYTRKVIAAGPVRSIARVDITGIGPSEATYSVRLIMSAFTNNIYSRQDIVIQSSAGGSVVYSPGIEKLAEETWSMDQEKGYLATWGKGAPGAGDIGLALVFDPAEFAGFAETDLDRYVKLTIPAGEKRTHWICGGWHLGITAPQAPQAAGWVKKIEDLSARVRAPLAPKVIVK